MPDTASLKAAIGNRYLIGREPGAGGMTIVYLAPTSSTTSTKTDPELVAMRRPSAAC
jgi:hypothetical protein